VSGIFVTQSDPMWSLVGATLQPADHSWSVLLDASAVLFDCPTIVAPSNPTIDWGDGPIEDAATITLIPLGGGAADDLQIAGALTSGKTLLLAPGTWNIGGAVVVYTETQELHGPAPADNGAVRLSNHEQITFAGESHGTAFGLGAYHATFGGVVDNIFVCGWNVNSAGNAIDPSECILATQVETSYFDGVDTWMEWMVAYVPPAGHTPCRPIQINIDKASDAAAVQCNGTFYLLNTPRSLSILEVTSDAVFADRNITAQSGTKFRVDTNDVWALSQCRAGGGGVYWGLLRLTSLDLIEFGPAAGYLMPGYLDLGGTTGCTLPSLMNVGHDAVNIVVMRAAAEGAAHDITAIYRSGDNLALGDVNHLTGLYLDANAAVHVRVGAAADRLEVTATKIVASVPLAPAQYTVAQLLAGTPSAAVAGQIVWCTNNATGACLAVSGGGSAGDWHAMLPGVLVA
jgi:hypothetical protein